MRFPNLVLGLSLCACKGTLPPYAAPAETPVVVDDDTDTERVEVQNDARFVGLWAVEQPFHAAYEVTHYDFQADGSLVMGTSFPGNCLGHLSEICVTGSVADCIPEPTETWCEPETTCTFGSRWHSEGDQTLVIESDCSDGIVRDIVLEFGEDAAQNTQMGSPISLVSVGGEQDWAHNGWEWAFRKCEDGTECGWL